MKLKKKKLYLVKRANALFASVGFEIPHNHLLDEQARRFSLSRI